MQLNRKRFKYVIKPMPGRHTGEAAISLMTVLKEKIMDANSREANYLIKNGKVMVNGNTIKEPRYPVGFGDVIHLSPTSESYRITSGKEGVFNTEKTKPDEQVFKIIGKYVAKGGKPMLRLHDGKTVAAAKDAMVNDSIQLGKKSSKVLKLEAGKSCYVVGGTHASETGKIIGITKGTALRDPLVKIQGSSGEFETLLRNIMVTGE